MHRRSIRDLTNGPRTAPGTALRALSRSLLTERDIDDATGWTTLAPFDSQYSTWLSERTYVHDDPHEAAARGKTPT